MGILSAIGAGAMVGGGILGSFLNYKSQQDTNALNKDLTREAWARDDNAVQRRVADLTAAGLSPTLAAGSAASTTQPIKAVAPTVDMTGTMSGLQQFGQLGKLNADIAHTEADTKLVQDQANKAVIESEYIKTQNDLAESQKEAQDIENVVKLTTQADRIEQAKNATKGGVLDNAYKEMENQIKAHDTNLILESPFISSDHSMPVEMARAGNNATNNIARSTAAFGKEIADNVTSKATELAGKVKAKGTELLNGAQAKYNAFKRSVMNYFKK